MRKVLTGSGACDEDAVWTVIAPAATWEQVVRDGLNVGTAFRRHGMRYRDKGDGEPGSFGRGKPGGHDGRPARHHHVAAQPGKRIRGAAHPGPSGYLTSASASASRRSGGSGSSAVRVCWPARILMVR